MKSISLHKTIAFSLAEILIVMTVIGVIATLTMPQLIGGIDDAHYRAGIKKAYTTLTNIAAIEKANDNLPTAANEEALINFFIALNDNLDVEGYALVDTNTDVRYTESIKKPSDIATGVVWKNQTFGDSSNTINFSHTTTSPWIVTADGMAFRVYYKTGRTCQKKSYLNAANTSKDNYINGSCLALIVDVNGLYKGPNRYTKYVTDIDTALTSATKLGKLDGDRVSFMLGSDGVAKGSPDNTVTGRILAGEK